MFFWGQIVSLCLSESADSNVMVEQTQEINFIPTMEGKSNKIKTVKPSYSGYKVHYTPYQKAFIFGWDYEISCVSGVDILAVRWKFIERSTRKRTGRSFGSEWKGQELKTIVDHGNQNR